MNYWNCLALLLATRCVLTSSTPLTALPNAAAPAAMAQDASATVSTEQADAFFRAKEWQQETMGSRSELWVGKWRHGRFFHHEPIEANTESA